MAKYELLYVLHLSLSCIALSEFTTDIVYEVALVRFITHLRDGEREI
jgi:hypothetical protein